MSDERAKKAKKALEKLQKINPHAQFITDYALSRPTEYVDTGSMGLNAIISGSLWGGAPSGKIVQFVGESQTFKSGFTLQLVAECQHMGKVVVLFDSEGAITPEGCKHFGINPEELIFMPCDSVEQVKGDIVQFLTQVREDKEFGQYAIMIDSLANLECALNIKRASEGNEASDMGSLAKAMKSLIKNWNNYSNATNTMAICTNHVYDNPGQLHPELEKNINGGKAAVYMPTVTVQLSKVLMKEGKDTSIDDKSVGGQKNYTGVVLRAVTVKNRIIQPLLETKVYLSFSKGMNKYFGLIDLMKDLGVVEAKGATYVDWNGEKLGFYKTFSKDVNLWENKLLPELEKRIGETWKYSSVNPPEDFDEDSFDVEDDDDVSESED